jgi:integrase
MVRSSRPRCRSSSGVSFAKDFSRTIKAANRASEAAGKPPALPEISLHALRHTHIANLLAQGVHAKVVSERAGHANVGITLGIYAHVIPGLEEGATVLVDASLRAALED